MDKITRILFLYTKLANGLKVNKINFCLETDSLPRTFDRDIEDIRIFLSENFCGEELVYDRLNNCYYLNSIQRRALDGTEYLFLERLLLDTEILRNDELNGLLSHLFSNTENAKTLMNQNKLLNSYYDEPLHRKALLKLHQDLSIVIRNEDIITVKYNKQNGEIVERDLLPCALKYDLGYLYLIAFRINFDDKYPAYFRLDRINSFSVSRFQKKNEKDRVKKFIENYSMGITQMYGGEFTEIIVECNTDFYSYIHDKFRDAAIIDKYEDTLKIRLHAFDEGFIRWIICQSSDTIEVVEPVNLRNKIAESAKKILKKYTEDE